MIRNIVKSIDFKESTSFIPDMFSECLLCVKNKDICVHPSWEGWTINNCIVTTYDVVLEVLKKIGGIQSSLG